MPEEPKKADDLYLEGNKEAGNDGCDSLQDAIYYYNKYLMLENDAFSKGWMYAGDSIAVFLMDEEGKYKDIIKRLTAIKDMGLDAYKILQKNSVDGSPWAKMKLAQLLMDNGRTSVDSEAGIEAKSLLMEAAAYGYTVANFYLAVYFYKDKDPVQYISCIRKSAEGDYFGAKKELETYYHDKPMKIK